MKNGLIINSAGTKIWFLDDELHREDGPAAEYADGSKFWYLNDELHRKDGPAVEYANGRKFWYINGIRHREDGPAVEYADGFKAWYYHGKLIGNSDEGMTNEKFLKIIKLKAFW